MKGLELSRKYFEAVGLPMLETEFAPELPRIAAGLVGEGSECFGFDDEISRDHDWGPGLCLWLSAEDYKAFGARLQAAYQALPRSFAGFPPRSQSPQGDGRVGVFPVGAFYARFIGLNRAPETMREWRALPESYLATVTNGAVFRDGLGEFTAIREKLLAFYPEDLRIKKIVARAAIMAQSGQYNYVRCLRHNEPVAAQLALAEFVKTGISMIFLLNRRYTPYYKWCHRGLRSLPLLGETAESFERLASGASGVRNAELIESICADVIKELMRQGLTSGGSDFLLDLCPDMMERIRDPELRRMHIMAE